MTSLTRVVQVYKAAGDYKITHAEAMRITTGMLSDLTSATVFGFVVWITGVFGIIGGKIVHGRGQ